MEPTRQQFQKSKNRPQIPSPTQNTYFRHVFATQTQGFQPNKSKALSFFRKSGEEIEDLEEVTEDNLAKIKQATDMRNLFEHKARQTTKFSPKGLANPIKEQKKPQLQKPPLSPQKPKLTSSRKNRPEIQHFTTPTHALNPIQFNPEPEQLESDEYEESFEHTFGQNQEKLNQMLLPQPPQQLQPELDKQVSQEDDRSSTAGQKKRPSLVQAFHTEPAVENQQDGFAMTFKSGDQQIQILNTVPAEEQENGTQQKQQMFQGFMERTPPKQKKQAKVKANTQSLKIQEFDSDDERESQEINTNVLVKNYDDWLAGNQLDAQTHSQQGRKVKARQKYNKSDVDSNHSQTKSQRSRVSYVDEGLRLPEVNGVMRASVSRNQDLTPRSGNSWIGKDHSPNITPRQENKPDAFQRALLKNTNQNASSLREPQFYQESPRDFIQKPLTKSPQRFQRDRSLENPRQSQTFAQPNVERAPSLPPQLSSETDDQKQRGFERLQNSRANRVIQIAKSDAMQAFQNQEFQLKQVQEQQQQLSIKKRPSQQLQKESFAASRDQTFHLMQARSNSNSRTSRPVTQNQIVKSRQGSEQEGAFFTQSKNDQVQVLNLEEKEDPMTQQQEQKKFFSPDLSRQVRPLSKSSLIRNSKQNLNETQQLTPQAHKSKRANKYTKKDPSISEIEEHLAIMKVSGVFKSQLSSFADFCQTFTSDFLKRQNLHEFLVTQCNKQIKELRVLDKEIDQFLDSFGFTNSNQIDKNQVGKVIYEKDQSKLLEKIKSKRMSQRAKDDEELVGLKSTENQEKRKKIQNKVDFEPEQATDLNDYIENKQIEQQRQSKGDESVSLEKKRRKPIILQKEQINRSLNINQTLTEQPQIEKILLQNQADSKDKRIVQRLKLSSKPSQEPDQNIVSDTPIQQSQQSRMDKLQQKLKKSQRNIDSPTLSDKEREQHMRDNMQRVQNNNSNFIQEVKTRSDERRPQTLSQTVNESLTHEQDNLNSDKMELKSFGDKESESPLKNETILNGIDIDKVNSAQEQNIDLSEQERNQISQPNSQQEQHKQKQFEEANQINDEPSSQIEIQESDFRSDSYLETPQHPLLSFDDQQQPFTAVLEQSSSLGFNPPDSLKHEASSTSDQPKTNEQLPQSSSTQELDSQTKSPARKVRLQRPPSQLQSEPKAPLQIKPEHIILDRPPRDPKLSSSKQGTETSDSQTIAKGLTSKQRSDQLKASLNNTHQMRRPSQLQENDSLRQDSTDSKSRLYGQETVASKLKRLEREAREKTPKVDPNSISENPLKKPRAHNGNKLENYKVESDLPLAPQPILGEFEEESLQPEPYLNQGNSLEQEKLNASDVSLRAPPLWDGETPEPDFCEQSDLMPTIMYKRQQRELEVIPEETTDQSYTGSSIEQSQQSDEERMSFERESREESPRYEKMESRFDLLKSESQEQIDCRDEIGNKLNLNNLTDDKSDSSSILSVKQTSDEEALDQSELGKTLRHEDVQNLQIKNDENQLQEKSSQSQEDLDRNQGQNSSQTMNEEIKGGNSDKDEDQEEQKQNCNQSQNSGRSGNTETNQLDKQTQDQEHLKIPLKDKEEGQVQTGRSTLPLQSPRGSAQSSNDHGHEMSRPSSQPVFGDVGQTCNKTFANLSNQARSIDNLSQSSSQSRQDSNQSFQLVYKDQQQPDYPSFDEDTILPCPFSSDSVFRKPRSKKAPPRRRKRRLEKQLRRPLSDTPYPKPPTQDLACQASFADSSDYDDDEYGSDVEDAYETHSSVFSENLKDIGLQTSSIHFKKVSKKGIFKREAHERAFSTDWSLSAIYDELYWKRQKKKQLDEAGNQVEEIQINQESTQQILSQIECEYNSQMLKHKQVSDNEQTSSMRCFQLYCLGLNTLQALMYGLRLRKEWELVTKPQYQVDVDFDKTADANMIAKVDEEQTIKLLVRCSKMYEARETVKKILQLTIEKDELSLSLSSENKQSAEYKKKIDQVKRLGAKITVMVNNLQDEHRIMKRPFIIKGKEYLSQIKQEQEQLESEFKQSTFVDESNTTGQGL